MPLPEFLYVNTIRKEWEIWICDQISVSLLIHKISPTPDGLSKNKAGNQRICKRPEGKLFDLAVNQYNSNTAEDAPLLNDIIAPKCEGFYCAQSDCCPEMKFALNHRSRFLHGHDCCETGKAFSQVRQEKYFRPDARTLQAAVVRALPRFASDFHPESDPAASSKTSRTGTLTLSQRSKRHLSHTLTVRSDSEAFLQRSAFGSDETATYFQRCHPTSEIQCRQSRSTA